MDQLDEQIKLARMGAFEEGAVQMEEQARTARCDCDYSDHQFHCPVSVWGRAANLLRTLKAAEEIKGERWEQQEEGVLSGPQYGD